MPGKWGARAGRAPPRSANAFNLHEFRNDVLSEVTGKFLNLSYEN